jgi:hypothetical protein
MRDPEGVAGVTVSGRTNEEALRECLETVVEEKFGRHAAIASVLRRGYDYSHSYASDILDVRLKAGQGLRIFMKDLGAHTRIKDGIKGMRERRERELRTYRDLLANAALGTPEYLGSVWDSDGRYWLLLEFVGGLQLRHAEFDNWIPAVGWLGRLQGCFEPLLGRLKECAWLQTHNEAFFRFRAHRALESIEGSYPHLAAPLRPIVRRYESLIGFMASQPRTFVHGAYTPGAIFIDPTCRPVRVCPFDWELAGVGSRVYDLAFVCDGFDEPRLDTLLRAYEDEVVARGIRVPPRKDTRYLIDCFRLHRIFNFISQTDERGYAEKDARRLVASAEELGRLVL